MSMMRNKPKWKKKKRGDEEVNANDSYNVLWWRARLHTIRNDDDNNDDNDGETGSIKMGIRSVFFYLFIFYFCMVNVPFLSVGLLLLSIFLCHFYFPHLKCSQNVYLKYILYYAYNIQNVYYRDTYTHTHIHTHSGTVAAMVTHKRLCVHRRKRAYSVFLCHRERMVKTKGEHTRTHTHRWLFSVHPNFWVNRITVIYIKNNMLVPRTLYFG